MSKWGVMIAAALAALAVSCARNDTSGRDLAAGLLARNAADAEGPGYDALSASTSHWSKEDLLAPKLDPLAGAAYVKPPIIGNFGTVGLTYPIEVPAGRAGMKPSMALVYSSSGGDGILGIGWSLSTGLGAIARDTGRGELFYDHRDVFTFNGKRMIKVDGQAGTEDGTYRLEIESGFSRFELSESARGGVWRVYDKSGMVTLYGADLSSRTRHPDDDNRTYIWNFSQSTDLNGNFMYAVYDDSDYRENHVLYLKEIRYTGNEREGLPARQWVRFFYTSREDAYVSRAAGFIMRMDRLLEAVCVGWDSRSGERELWRYEPVFRESADSRRPLLDTVRSDRHSTRPAFEYREAEHYFLWQNAANPFAGDAGEEPDDVRYFEGDFNGDGLSDMAFFNPETGEWKAAEAIPSGVEGAGGGYAAKIYGRRFRGYGGGRICWFKGGATGDYNGDGRSDIPFYLPETRELWVAEHNGICFDFRVYGKYGAGLDPAACEWFTGDFDGNALSDVLLFHEPAGRWTFMKNGGGSFEFIDLPRHFKNLFRDDYDPDSSLNSDATSDTGPQGRHRERVHFICGDYNGDGRTDVSLYDSRSGAWLVGENRRVDASTTLGMTACFTLDWYRYGGFSAPERALFANDRFSGDFNGDGLSDFLMFDRDSGEWWIGETGDRRISFRKFSRAPKFRDVTRWLQGDFNGDGRTDIGFYSASDGNFWIGEAEPDGFRYRAYTNLRDCPNPARILAAPLPRDEVVMADGRAVAPGDGVTTVVAFRYDGNSHEGRGERVFAGRFTPESTSTEFIPSAGEGLGISSAEEPALSGVEGTELLIYNRAERRFYLKEGSADPVPALDVPGMEADGARVLFGGRPGPWRGRDGILYYRPEGSVIGGTEHRFFLISHTGTGFSEEPFAAFDSGAVSDFDIGMSLYWAGRFAEYDPDSYLLVLDDRSEEPGFVLFDKDGAARRLAVSGALDAEFFREARSRAGLRVLSCVFGGEGSASLLAVDFSSEAHRWYRGRITPGGDGVSFEALSGAPRFYNEGFLGHVAAARGSSTEFVYAAADGGPVCFHRLLIEGGRVSFSRDYVMAEQVSFTGDFDHEGRPVVFDGAAAKRVVLDDGSFRLEEMAPGIVFDRPDLMRKVYPFAWLQGDYNGDGKTDIGFFHLKERSWYFALTQGAVPDLLTGVKNGIGGSYAMEYVNSSGFDNTGGDGVPDLPMNYRVCSRLEVADGLGRSVVARYGYKNGSSFSAFVNGVRESDCFGFGEFTVTDAYGAKTVSRYHAMPYDDFRMNRALGGAVRETRRIGSDHVEYERSEHDYTVRVIEPSPPAPLPQGEGGTACSYLVEPTETRRYARGVLVETRTSSIELVSGKYEMTGASESVTDHYSDAAHAPVTASTSTRFENIQATNEMRAAYRKNLAGTDHETTVSYEYDERGNVVRELVSYTGSGLAPVSDKIIEYYYDGCGNRVRETNASGSPARIAEKAYDGELRQFVVEERALGDAVIFSTVYEIGYGPAFGAPVKKTDPNGNSAYFEYDGLGRLARERADTDAGTETLNEYAYSDAFPLSGIVRQYTGASGALGMGPGMIETRVFADGMGRKLHTLRSATGEPGRRYIKTGMVTYDRVGRVTRRSQPDWAADDEIGRFVPHLREKNPTVTEYDGSGRPSKITLPPAYDGEPEASTSFVYHDPWEVIETNSLERSKRVVRNGRGLVLYAGDSGIGDASASLGTGSGAGAFVSAMIGFVYDIAGNRVKKFDLPVARGLSPSLREVDASLFAPGVKDTSGSNVAAWRYDAFGRVTESSDPDLGYARLDYNAFGEPAAVTDALGRVTAFEYDRLGRMTVKRLPGDEGTVRYVYDSYRGCANALGRVAYIEDPVSAKKFCYDKIGRVKEETRVMKPSPPTTLPRGEGRYITRYQYDLLGRKILIEYPREPHARKGMAVSYGRCAMGVTSITADNGGETLDIVKNVRYNEFGRMIEMSRGNNAVTAYTYDRRGRLERLLTVARHNGEEWKVQDVAYEFRPDDSIAAIENAPNVDAEGACEGLIRYDYEYDGLNRLAHARGDYNKTLLQSPDLNPGIAEAPDTGAVISKKFEIGYEYSPGGNLTARTVYDSETGAVDDRWEYTYANHAATAIGTARLPGRYEMEYDAAGNMTYQRDREKNMAKRMAYDSLNRIRLATDPDTGEELGRYDYDEQGFRVRKVSARPAGSEARSVETISPSMYLTLETQKDIDGRPIPGSSMRVSHIYLNGVRIAAVAPGGRPFHYLTDQVDSVTVTLDHAGMIVSQNEYLPFGGTWITEGDRGHAPKYNSQELDRETGYYFYNARHYDPDIARFVTADTVISSETNTQAWNRYAYCSNNPIMYKDPTGHVEIGMEEARIGDFMMRAESPKDQIMAEKAGVVAKLGAEVSNRILSQTSCRLGHSAMVQQSFKYKGQVVGVMVTDIQGDKIVERIISKEGSMEWDPKKEKWTKYNKYETIDQYRFFRVGTVEEGKNAINKLDKAMKEDNFEYDMKGLLGAVGGAWSLLTNSKNWKRNLGKFKDGDNKMVCTEVIAWAYEDDKNAKLGKSFLALPDQIFENQKMYDINGKLIPGVKPYDRSKVREEYNRSKDK
ncbi:MAG: hypothetical protein JW807_15235 [Spirochaetes bacterium]|nr:hypothetical protein [Spirochaetota bacterium]